MRISANLTYMIHEAVKMYLNQYLICIKREVMCCCKKETYFVKLHIKTDITPIDMKSNYQKYYANKCFGNSIEKENSTYLALVDS